MSPFTTGKNIFISTIPTLHIGFHRHLSRFWGRSSHLHYHKSPHYPTEAGFLILTVDEKAGFQKVKAVILRVHSLEHWSLSSSMWHTLHYSLLPIRAVKVCELAFLGTRRPSAAEQTKEADLGWQFKCTHQSFFFLHEDPKLSKY